MGKARPRRAANGLAGFCLSRQEWNRKSARVSDRLVAAFRGKAGLGRNGLAWRVAFEHGAA